MHEWDVVVPAEEVDDLPRLALAQQPMVHEDAGQLLADRFVDQKRGHGGVDAARQTADDTAAGHLIANARHLRLAKLRHAPIPRTAGDLAHEIGDQRGPLGRMHHFGMELDAVELARIVGDGGKRRAGGDAHGTKARRQLGHPVAVAHPHLGPLAVVEHTVEERRLVDDLKFGPPEFAFVPWLHLAAERGDHGLLAIANAEHRKTGAEQGIGRLRRTALMDGGRTAGQDDRARGCPLKRGFRLIEGHDLRIDPGLAHAARDELGHLAAEIDDQDAVLGAVRRFVCGNLVHVRHGRWL